jgi:hypothetical protein
MLTNGTIHLIYVITLNICAPNFIEQTLLKLKGPRGPDTIMVGKFNIPLSSRGIPYRQKFNKETSELSHIVNQMIPTKYFIQLLWNICPSQKYI